MKSFRVVFSAITSSVTLAALKVSAALAQSPVSSGAQAARGVGQPTDLFGDGAVFTTVVNTMLFIIGAVAVIMVILGGFRYVISGGNSASVTSAKNTILYAIVGIIVAVLSYAVINFILTTLNTATTTGGVSGL